MAITMRHVAEKAGVSIKTVSGKTLSVGMVIPRSTDPAFPEVVLGVEKVAQQHGYSVFLCNASDDPLQELEYVDILAGKQVAGVILSGSVLNKIN